MNRKWSIISLISRRSVQVSILVAFVVGALIVVQGTKDTQEAFDSGRVIYVQAMNNPGGDGRSWETAYKSLPDALAVAGENDGIWMAKGVYKFSSSETVLLPDGLKIYGGFSGFETALVERDPMKYRTILGVDDSQSTTLVANDSATLDGVFLSEAIVTSGVNVVAAAASYPVTVIFEGTSLKPNVVVRTNKTYEKSNFFVPTTTVGADIDDKYFILQESDRAVYVWMEVDNDQDLDDYITQTIALDPTARTILVNRFSPSDTNITLAERITDALDDDASFDVSYTGGTFVVTNTVAGILNGASHASEGNTGFGLNVINGLSTTDTPLSFSDNSATFTFDTANGISFTLENSTLKTFDNVSFNGWSDTERRPLSSSPTVTVSKDAVTSTIYMSFASIIYVDQNATAGLNNGSSWANAYTNVSQALAEEKAAQVEGDEIWIAAGIYNVLEHGGRTRVNQPSSATILMHEGVRLYGGFKGDEISRYGRVTITENARPRMANETIFDGGGECWHIVTGADDSIIDGFVIRNGNANGADSLTDARGAGMFNYAASPTVRNCVFYGNRADGYGGAFYCFLGSPKVENCIFGQKNTVPLEGLRAQPMYPTLRKDSFIAPVDRPQTGFVPTDYDALGDGDGLTPIIQLDWFEEIEWTYVENVTLEQVTVNLAVSDGGNWTLGYYELVAGFWVFNIYETLPAPPAGMTDQTITFSIVDPRPSSRWWHVSSDSSGAIVTEVNDGIQFPEQNFGNPPYSGFYRLFDGDIVSGAVEAPASGGSLYMTFGAPTTLTGIEINANIADNGAYLVLTDNAAGDNWQIVTEFILDQANPNLETVTFNAPVTGTNWAIVKAGPTERYALFSEMTFLGAGTSPFVIGESPYLGEAVTLLDEGKRIFDGDVLDNVVNFGTTGGEVSWTFLDDHIRLIEVGLIASQKDDAVYEVSYYQPVYGRWLVTGSFRLNANNTLCSTQFTLPRPPPSSPLYEWISREWRITKITPSLEDGLISEVVFNAEQPEFSVTHKDPRKEENPEIFRIFQTDNPYDMLFKLGPSNYLKDNDEDTPVFATNKLAASGSVTADFGQKTELTYIGFIAATNKVDNNVFSVTADGTLVGTFKFDTPGGFNGLTFPSPRAARIWVIEQTTLTFKDAPISEIVYNKRQPVTIFGFADSNPYLLRDGLLSTSGLTSRPVEPGDVEETSDDPHILIDIRNYEELQPSEIVGVSMYADAVDNVSWSVEYFDYASLTWISLGTFKNDTPGEYMGASWPPSANQRLYRIRQISYTGEVANYTDLELKHNSHAGNFAKFGGGAVYLENRSAPIFTNCDFQGNFCGIQVQDGDSAPEQAGARGGAVSNVGSYPVFESCDFDANYIWGYGDGGAIYNQGSNTGSTAVPVVNNCSFRRNRASMYVERNGSEIGALHHGFGGAIYNSNSSPQITNTTFGGMNKWDGNTSTRNGGAIYNDAGSQPSIAGCIFASNQALISGGAIYNIGVGAAASISNSQFYNNRAANGGAAYNAGTATVYTSCYFKGNVTYDAQKLTYGGSGFVPGFSMYSSTVFESNLEYLTNFVKTTQFNGFARFGDYFAGMVSGTYSDLADPIQRNVSMLPPVPEPTPIGGANFPAIAGYYGAKGGAVYNENASTLFSECVFENNPLTITQSPNAPEFRVASRAGGAIYCGGADTTIDPASTDIESEGGIVTLTNCKFYGNAASGEGGAVYAGQNYILNVQGCDFGKKDDLAASNTAGARRDYEAVGSDALPIDGRGGAIYATDAELTVQETKFYNNHAGPIVEDIQAQAVYPGVGEGGAIYTNAGTLTISDNTYFYRNNTHNDDAATSTSGGAIAFVGTTVDVNSIQFDENYCLNNFNGQDGVGSALGGAIYGVDGELMLKNCVFHDNKVNINLTFGTASKTNGNIDPTTRSFLDTNFFDFVGTNKVTKMIGNGIIDSHGGAVHASLANIDNCTFKWNIAAEGEAGDVGEDGESVPSSSAGGAVFMADGSVSNSTFIGNISSDMGGALDIGRGTVKGSVFERNWTGWRGSAISADSAEISSCTLSENAAGGIRSRNLFSNLADVPIWPASHPDPVPGCGAVWGGTVENSLIKSNIACSDFDPSTWRAVTWNGFGAGAGNSTLTNTELRGNLAGWSAALFDTDTVACLVTSNTAVTGKGGVSISGDTHINSVFIANTAADDGGAFGVGNYDFEASTPLQLFHCSLTRNYAQLQGGGVAIDGLGFLAEITNTIIWGNTAGEAAGEFDALNEIVTDNGDFSITYSCIRGSESGGISSGVGNIGGQPEDDPLFLDPQTNNLRLQPGSPCINRGVDLTATYPETAFDFDNEIRDDNPDIGADEFTLDEAEIVVLGNSNEITTGTSTVQMADNTAWGLHTPASVNGVVQAPYPSVLGTVIYLDSTASDEDSYYVGYYLKMISGTGVEYLSEIKGYTGATREAQMAAGVYTALDDTSEYRLYQPHVFEVKNVGIRDLNLVDQVIALSGSHQSDFIVLDKPTTLLASGRSDTFVIAYGPELGIDQSRNAIVSVYSNDSDEQTYTFAIQGEAGTGLPEIRVAGLSDTEIVNNDLSPDLLDGTYFGQLDYRAGAKVVSFNITNVGGNDLILENLTPGGLEETYVDLTGDTSDFTVVTQPSNGTIRPLQSVGFEVRFDPVSVGSRSASITILSNDADDGRFSFDINGEGIGPRIEVMGNNQMFVNIEDLKDEDGVIVDPLRINTPSLANYTDFGDLDATRPVAIRYFTIKNSGTQLLNLTSAPAIQVIETDSNWFPTGLNSNFVVQQAPGSNVPPDFNTSFALEYRPTSSTSHYAIVQIANDDRLFSFRVEGSAIFSTTLPPVAVGTINEQSGTVEVDVNVPLSLNASDSYDQDGYLNLVRWEGTPGAEFNASSTTLPPEFFFSGTTPSTPGIHDVNLTVRDNDALTDTQQFTVLVGKVLKVTLPSTLNENSGFISGAGTVSLANGYIAEQELNVALTVTVGSSLVSVSNVTIFEGLSFSTFDINVGDDNLLGHTDVTIQAAATGFVTNSATMKIIDNDTPGIVISGKGYVIPNDIDNKLPSVKDSTEFSPVYNDTNSVEAVFTIANSSSIDLSLNNIGTVDEPSYVDVIGLNGDDSFSVSLQPSDVIGAGGSGQFRIMFMPGDNSISERYAEIRISSNAASPDNSYRFLVKGTRGANPEIQISFGATDIASGDDTPSTVDGTDFGGSPMGVSVDHEFIITNFGDVPLGLSGSPLVRFTGANLTDFVLVTPPEVTTLGTATSGDNTTTFTVGFKPRGLGERTAILIIDNTDPDEDPYFFTLSGTGTPPADIEIYGKNDENVPNGSQAILSNGTDFGEVEVGSGIGNSFTIRNDGSPGTTIILEDSDEPNGRYVQITGSSYFSITQQPGGDTVTTDQSLSFIVTYEPLATGNHSATVRIESDDVLEPVYEFDVKGSAATGLANMDVIGNGVVISDGSTSASTVNNTDYGLVEANTTVTRTFIIQNSGVESILRLTGNPYVSITADSGFAITEQPTQWILADGDTTTFDVEFTPTEIDVEYSATITIRHDSGDQEYTFVVAGNGTDEITDQDYSAGGGDGGGCNLSTSGDVDWAFGLMLTVILFLLLKRLGGTMIILNRIKERYAMIHTTAPVGGMKRFMKLVVLTVVIPMSLLSLSAQETVQLTGKVSIITKCSSVSQQKVGLLYRNSTGKFSFTNLTWDPNESTVDKPMSEVKNGSTLTVEGVFTKRPVFKVSRVVPGETTSQKAALTPDIQNVTMPTPGPVGLTWNTNTWKTGTLRVLGIVVKYSDAEVTTSNSVIHGRFFSDPYSMNEWYKEASRNQVDVEGKVVGPYSLPYSKETVQNLWATADGDDTTWSAVLGAEAINLAIADGHDENNDGDLWDEYDQIFVFYPPTDNVGWGGLSGAPISMISTAAPTMIHELGHNLGWLHSSANMQEYGDGTDIMGEGDGYPNSMHALQLGWIPNDNVELVKADGIYRIESFAKWTNNPKIIAVDHPNVAGLTGPHYISFRAKHRWDEFTAETWLNKVYLHSTQTALMILNGWSLPPQMPGSYIWEEMLEGDIFDGTKGIPADPIFPEYRDIAEVTVLEIGEDYAIIDIDARGLNGNHPPVVGYVDEVMLASNRSHRLLLNGYDADGDEITYELKSEVRGGGTINDIAPIMVYNAPKVQDQATAYEASFDYRARDKWDSGIFPRTTSIAAIAPDDNSVVQLDTGTGDYTIVSSLKTTPTRALEGNKLIRGYIVPEETGKYTFTKSGNISMVLCYDEAPLLVSKDTLDPDPYNTDYSRFNDPTHLAYHPTKYPGNAQPVVWADGEYTLTAGNWYYFSVTGAKSFEVKWARPESAPQATVIPGGNLRPFVDNHPTDTWTTVNNGVQHSHNGDLTNSHPRVEKVPNLIQRNVTDNSGQLQTTLIAGEDFDGGMIKRTWKLFDRNMNPILDPVSPPPGTQIQFESILSYDLLGSWDFESLGPPPGISDSSTYANDIVNIPFITIDGSRYTLTNQAIVQHDPSLDLGTNDFWLEAEIKLSAYDVTVANKGNWTLSVNALGELVFRVGGTTLSTVPTAIPEEDGGGTKPTIPLYPNPLNPTEDGWLKVRVTRRGETLVLSVKRPSDPVEKHYSVEASTTFKGALTNTADLLIGEDSGNISINEISITKQIPCSTEWTHNYEIGYHFVELTVEDREHEVVSSFLEVLVHPFGNNIPIAEDIDYAFNYHIDGRFKLILPATDADGDVLTYKIETLPTTGLLYDAPTGGNLLLVNSTLAAGENTVYFEFIEPRISSATTDLFEFSVSDGGLHPTTFTQLESNAATCSLDIVDPGDVIVSQIYGSPTEAGGTATFTVRLSVPTDFNVVVPIISADPTIATVSPQSLIFSDRNWNMPKTVTITGVNDLIDNEPDRNVVIYAGEPRLVSEAPAYTQLPRKIVLPTPTVVEDDDIAGLVLSETNLFTDETGTTESFTVKLQSEPVGQVVVTITSTDISEGLVSVGAGVPSASLDLTFNNANWNTEREVFVTGQDDTVEDGNETYPITVGVTQATSDTLTYGVLSDAIVTVTNQDDDIYLPLISGLSGGDTDENGKSVTFNVTLTKENTADVYVSVTVEDPTEATASLDGVTGTETLTLLFLAGEWNVAQTVTIIGKDDGIVDGPIEYKVEVALQSGSADPNYNKDYPVPGDPSSLPWPTLILINADNDTPGLTVGPVSNNTREDGTTATFTVNLASRPIDDVIVLISSEDAGEVTAAPTALTFTVSDWSTTQTVTVTGQDDTIPDGDRTVNIILDPTSTGDLDYDNMPSVGVPVVNEDDETSGPPALVLNTTELTVPEGGSNILLVSLNYEPLNNVNVSGSIEGDADLLIDGESTLTFSPLNWNVRQAIQISAEQDADADNGTATLTLTTSGSEIADVTVAVTEADDEGTGTGGGGDDDSGGSCSLGLGSGGSGLIPMILLLLGVLISRTRMQVKKY